MARCSRSPAAGPTAQRCPSVAEIADSARRPRPVGPSTTSTSGIVTDRIDGSLDDRFVLDMSRPKRPVVAGANRVSRARLAARPSPLRDRAFGVLTTSTRPGRDRARHGTPLRFPPRGGRAPRPRAVLEQDRRRVLLSAIWLTTRPPSLRRMLPRARAPAGAAVGGNHDGAGPRWLAPRRAAFARAARWGRSATGRFAGRLRVLRPAKRGGCRRRAQRCRWGGSRCCGEPLSRAVAGRGGEEHGSCPTRAPWPTGRRGRPAVARTAPTVVASGPPLARRTSWTAAADQPGSSTSRPSATLLDGVDGPRPGHPRGPELGQAPERRNRGCGTQRVALRARAGLGAARAPAAFATPGPPVTRFAARPLDRPSGK